MATPSHDQISPSHDQRSTPHSIDTTSHWRERSSKARRKGTYVSVIIINVSMIITKFYRYMLIMVHVKKIIVFNHHGQRKSSSKLLEKATQLCRHP